MLCITSRLYQLVEKIDQALENKGRCRLVVKTGRYYHGIMTDSWVRLSGGKLRGKVKFNSDEKGEVEIDSNDILDILFDAK